MARKKKNWDKKSKQEYIKERFVSEANKVIDKTNPGDVDWDKFHKETGKQVAKEFEGDSKKNIDPEKYKKD